MSKRAGLYFRISDDREGRQLGVSRQDEDCTALAERLGSEVVDRYEDNDISASTRSRKARPDYRRLLQDARSGRINQIIAYTSGRLTRRPREHEDLIELAEQHGTELRYVASPSFDLNTAAGRRVARILAATDAGEAEDIQERIVRAKQQTALAGKWRGGRRPFGYAADGVTLVPGEAAVIAWASQELLSGMSMRAITAEMNARGSRTSTGRPWNPIHARAMLMRPRNAGFVDHDGEIVCYEAEWPPAVDPDTWRGVVALLSDPARVNAPGGAPRWMLSGIARCGIEGCGNTVVITHPGRIRPGAKPAYGCPPTWHVARAADRLNDHVASYIIERLSRDDAVELLHRDSVVDTAALHTRARALREQMDELGLLFARRELDARQVAIANRELRSELEGVEAQVSAASRGSIFEGIIGVTDVAAAWEAMPMDRKRAIVSALVVVTVFKAKRGRPPGWQAGRGYFDPNAVSVVPIEPPG